jgi:amino acid adenylation domain-containing protein/thioester reductase-like protein
VGPEVRVALCAERTPETLIALLAILEAGGAYVAIEPSYPARRVAFLVEDSGSQLLLSTEAARSSLPSLPIPTLTLDTLHLDQELPEPLSRNATPLNLAYVVYTSGSTGRPKGVLVSHQSLVQHALEVRRRYEVSPADRVLQFASLAFDVAAEEIFPTWLSGAAVVLRPQEPPAPGAELLRFIEGRRISLVNLPAAYWHDWVSELVREKSRLPACLRRVVVGSEAVGAEHLALWRQHVGEGVAWNNAYGLSECTITSTLYSPPERQEHTRGGTVPIGKPLSHAQAYVLDDGLRQVPAGTSGELYLGGVGLARGYLHRPELTAERFIPDPFGGAPGSRLYRTGDLARWLPDGNLEFLGRRDQQVKLRGFRIDLGEIEAVLRQHPAVEEAVALLQEPSPGVPCLAAYVVVREAISEERLRGALQEWLPEHLVPQALLVLPKLPRTAGGKIDRQALPMPRVPEADAGGPRTPIQETLTALWVELLGTPRPGLHDDFFAAGGQSQLAARLLARIRQEFQVELSLQALYLTPTVAGLASTIEALQRGAVRTQAPGPLSSRLPAKVVLPPEIRPLAARTSRVEAPRALFLTGATGFLGAFLLGALLERTEARIHCLVRARDEEEGVRRLRGGLESFGLWKDAYAHRIIPAVGDLGQPLLGLSERHFQRLAEEVAALYHNGAVVNFLHGYAQLEAPNVQGTQEVLRMATLSTPKPVHYVSTLSVLGGYGAPGEPRFEEIDVPKRAPGLEDGYSQSKWAAERLLVQARQRGLPVCIYRPGRVMGHTGTGAGNTGDLLCRMLKGCIQLGLSPELELPVDVTPVDFVCDALVHLSLQPGSEGKVFHLINPEPVRMDTLVEYIQRRGYPLERVPYRRWRAALEEILARGVENALHPLLPLFAEEGLRWDHARYDCQNVLTGLTHSGIRCPPVDARLLDAYFDYFLRSGFLTPAPASAG